MNGISPGLGRLVLPSIQMLLSKSGVVAWLALIISLLLTLLVTTMLQRQQTRSISIQFEQNVHEVVTALTERLQDHEQILLGAAGLFAASENVTRDDWRVYIERLQLQQNYPGILGVGFSALVRPQQLTQHIQTIQNEGFTDYQLRPAGIRDIYTSIIYIEPFTGRNLAAFGYDMYSEPIRRKAMALAVSNGETTISGKVRLVQETYGREQAGFLMYVPVYRNGSVPATAEQRWQALEGFVYSPYRADDLMHDILATTELLLDFRLYDGEQITQDALMYDSAIHQQQDIQRQELNTTRHIQAYGHKWTISLQPTPALTNKLSSSLPWWVLILGVVISLLLFLLVITLLCRRQHALLLAGEMSKLSAESEERFHQLFLSVGQGVMLHDVSGQIVDANPAAENIMGMSITQMRGLHFYDPCWRITSENGSNFPDECHPVMLALRDGCAVIDVVIRLWHHSRGTWIWLQLSAYPRQNIPKKDEPYVYVVFSDISARKHAELLLREQASHTQAILDTMVDGIVTLDNTGLMLTVNPAVVRIFGYTADQLMGQNISMLLPAPDAQTHGIDPHNTGLAWLNKMGPELNGLRQDGSLFDIELQMAEIMRDGQPHYVGMLRDISERKQMDRMKSEFVSTVSHELRTPLTSISGALSMVDSGKLGELSVLAQKMIRIAHKNSKRLTYLINDLLDLEKLLAGKLTFDMQIQPLQPLVQLAIDSHQTFSTERQIKLVLKSSPSDTQVRVDSQRLQQVLANLLSNAIKFSPESGTVNVSIQVAYSVVRVAVHDQGAGIPESFRTRIFERFAQADSSDTRKEGGTGLGLAITRELLERMAGRIGFDSETGKGTTFWFELPVYQPLLQPAADVAAKMALLEPAVMQDLAAITLLPNFYQATNLLNMRQQLPCVDNQSCPLILHVEDDVDLHQVIVGMAEGVYQFEHAGCLKDTHSKIALQHFDAVILDIGLPDGSGWSILNEIRRLQPQAAVIILSGCDITPEQAKLVESVLLKSQISANQLLDALGKRFQSTALRS